MKNVLILSPYEEFSNSLKDYLEMKLNKNVIILKLFESLKFEFEDIKILINSYNKICNLIEGISYEILRDSVAILDLPFLDNSKSNTNLLQTKGNLNQLAGMLLFTYPEIYWIFTYYNESSEKNFTENFIHYTELFDENKIKGYLVKPSPLFDGYGIRNEIKKYLKEESAEKENLSYIILREKKLAASIDEEIAYSFLNSYIAYKSGFRSFLIYTYQDMEYVLGENSQFKINLAFEDLFLNFPDRTKHLSNLSNRDKNFPKLIDFKNLKRRIFLTVGHKYYANKKNNLSYIKSLKLHGLKIKNVYKPTGGIFNILKDSGVIIDYKKFKKEELKKTKPKIEKEEVSSHSAPGILLLISEKLISRAKKLFNDGNKVENFVHGSLLALEAQELLGYKTPTTCLEAIALKHKNEVKAECMFYGVSYNFDLKNRFKEIDKEIEAVSKWFKKSIRKKAYMNAQMEVITELIKIFREFGQYDEEMECIKRFNKLNRRFFFSRKPYLIPFWPIRAYIEGLLTSLTRFLISITFIPFLAGIIQYFLHKSNEFWKHILQAYMTFFCFQPIDNYFESDSSLTLFLIIGGFIHLGIFISYLYSTLTRK